MKTFLLFILSLITGFTLSAQIVNTVNISYVMNKTNPPSYTFSSDFSGEEANYHWYFGELAVSRDISPTYTFQYSGNQVIRLVITDKAGQVFSGRLEGKFEGKYPLFSSAVQTGTGKVTDLAGVDSCGLVIVLDNGLTLLPVDMIPDFVLQPGQQVKIAYEILNRTGTYCQAGKPARIHRIALIAREAHCKAFFISEVLHAATDSVTRKVKFINQSSGDIRECHWSFSDGTTSRDKNPEHIFPAAGEFKVCLSILTTDGCKSEYCTIVKISNPVTVPVIYTGKGTVVDKTGLDGCGLLILMNDGKVLLPLMIIPRFELKPGQRLELAWEIVRNTATICMAGIPVRIHKIAELPPDTCKAYFTATNQLWSDLSMMRRMVFANLSEGNLRECTWTFGDGTTSHEKRPVHEYKAYGEYNVCLEIVTTQGCRSTYCDTVVVQDPGCSFELVIKRKDPAALAYAFFAVSRSDVEAVKWDFGDGATADTLNPVHTYENPGTYEVTCTLVTVSGCKATHSRKLTIPAPPLPLCPGAINLLLFDPYGPLTVCNGKAIVTLLDESGEPYKEATYSWSDGTKGDTARGLCPNKPYTVHALISGVCQKHTSFAFLTTPQWRMTYNGDKCSFSVISPSDSIVYRWNFGDGQEAFGATVDYDFKSAGRYNVTLTAISGNSMAESTQEVTVMNNTTSAGKTALSGFTLFPNPVNEVLTIDWGLPVTGDLLIEITDMKGLNAGIHRIPAGDFRRLELPVGHLSEGIYLVKITAGNTRFKTQKFVRSK